MSDAGSLWVSISSWRLRALSSDDPVHPPDPFQRYVHDVVPRINAVLYDKGLISSWLVRTGAHTMTYVGVYTSEEALQELWAWAASDPEFGQLFEDYLEPIHHETGPLTDVFHLGSRWRYPEFEPEGD
jgi:hypothetical protein